jgi:polar amino acid transport system substrate-binding protein
MFGILRMTAIVLVGTLVTHAASADTFDDIKARGKLVVGGKADYKPFGFRQPDGSVVGLSVDLANEMAKALGVELELVPTTAANMLEFLQQGKVDVIIAAMNDTPERRKVVYIVDPGYAASPGNPPCRTPIETRLYSPEFLLAIQVTAALD